MIMTQSSEEGGGGGSIFEAGFILKFSRPQAFNWCFILTDSLAIYLETRA